MNDIRDFGAHGDGVSNDTAAIQRAIDAAASNGNAPPADSPAYVHCPPGTCLSGTLFLKSGVSLHLAKGAVLKASPDPADYNPPDFAPQNYASPRDGDNTSGGHLIVGVGLERIAIRGPGRIDGNAPAFLRLPDGSHPPSKHDIPWRPAQLVWLCECHGVEIRDVEIANAPYWSCFLHGCEDVVVEDARIRTIREPHTYNGDGLDIDSCRRVAVRRCDISTADDSPGRPFRNLVFSDIRLSGETATRIGTGMGAPCETCQPAQRAP